MADLKDKALSSTFSKNPKELKSPEAVSNQTTNTSSAATNIITISNQKDFSYILKKSGKRLLVVVFFAKWCGPCQILFTKLEEFAKSYDDRISLVKVDVDECEGLTLEYNILAVPTFLIMRNKKKLQQFFSGNIQTLEKTVEKYAGKPIVKATKMKKF